MFVSWRLGLVPSGGDAATMTIEETQTLSQLIMTWEALDERQRFEHLAKVLGSKG